MDLESLIKKELYNWSKSMDYTKFLILNLIPEYSPSKELLSLGYLGYKGRLCADMNSIDGVHYISTDFLHFIDKNKGIKFLYDLIEIGEYRDIYLDYTRVTIKVRLEGFKITLLNDLINGRSSDMLFLASEKLSNNEIYINEFRYLKPNLVNSDSYAYCGYINYSILLLNTLYIEKLSILYIKNEVDFNNFINILKYCSINYNSCLIEYRWEEYMYFMDNFNFIKFMSLRTSIYKNMKILIYNFKGDNVRLSYDLISNHLDNVILVEEVI